MCALKGDDLIPYMQIQSKLHKLYVTMDPIWWLNLVFLC